MTACVAWTNYLKSAAITSTNTQPTLPATNLAGDQGSPAMGWQSVNLPSAVITITPTVAAQRWRVMGVFRTNLTAAASVVFELWQTTVGIVRSVTLPGPVQGYGQVVCALPADVVADFLKITITDAANPDGFMNIALAFAGPAWFPAGSTGFDSTVGRDESVNEVITRGGQEFPNLLWQRRRWNITFDSLRQSETWQQVDPLLRQAKAGSNVFFAPDVASSYLQQEATFGRLKSTADISYPYGGADRRRWQAAVTERL